MLLKALQNYQKRHPFCCITRERKTPLRNSLCLYFSIILATPLPLVNKPPVTGASHPIPL